MKKKRYSLSLNQENVDRFQAIIKTLKMPAGTMSSVCDEAIEKIADMLETASKKGSFTITDMFTLIGKNLEEMQKEEKSEKKK